MVGPDPRRRTGLNRALKSVMRAAPRRLPSACHGSARSYCRAVRYLNTPASSFWVDSPPTLPM